MFLAIAACHKLAWVSTGQQALNYPHSQQSIAAQQDEISPLVVEQTYSRYHSTVVHSKL